MAKKQPQMRIMLAPYTLRVRKRHDEAALPLGNLGGGVDLLDLLHEYFTERLTQSYNDEPFQRYLGCEDCQPAEKVKAKSDRVLSGLMRVGRYGEPGWLVNSETNEITHYRTAPEADLRPYYFRLEVPVTSTQGILILQKRGSGGIRKTLVADFTKWLRARHLFFTIDVFKPCRAELLEQYVKPSRIANIQYVRRFDPSDPADSVRKPNQEALGEMVIILKAPHGKALPSVMDKVLGIGDGKADLAEFVELYADQLPEGFDPTDVKLQVVQGKNRNLVSLKNLDGFSPPSDVSDMVRRDPATNDPVFADVNDRAAKLAATIRTGIKQVVDDV